MFEAGSRSDGSSEFDYDHPERERSYHIGFIIIRRGDGSIELRGQRGIDPTEHKGLVEAAMSLSGEFSKEELLEKVAYEVMELGPWKAHCWWVRNLVSISDFAQQLEDLFHFAVYPFTME